MIDLITPIAIFVGGIAVGLPLGYFFAKGRYMDKYWKVKRELDVERATKKAG